MLNACFCAVQRLLADHAISSKTLIKQIVNLVDDEPVSVAAKSHDD